MFRSALTGLVLLLTAIGCGQSDESPVPSCHGEAVARLESQDPEGYRVYQSLRANGDDTFARYLDCERAEINYHTGRAVHEGVHALGLLNGTDRTKYHFVLRGGERITLARRNLFPRADILKSLDREISQTAFAKIYLEEIGGESDLLGLLDELNAYIHSLWTDFLLQKYIEPNLVTSDRDGVAAMMAFVQSYLELARERRDPWRQIADDPNYRDLILKLWVMGEEALETSCSSDRFGIQDGYFIRSIYDGFDRSPIEVLFELAGRTHRTPKIEGCGHFMTPDSVEVAKFVPSSTPSKTELSHDFVVISR